jgi:hypothetical protein
MRLIIPRAYFEAHIAFMHEVITGKFSELVFSFDGIGSSD